MGVWDGMDGGLDGFVYRCWSAGCGKEWVDGLVDLCMDRHLTMKTIHFPHMFFCSKVFILHDSNFQGRVSCSLNDEMTIIAFYPIGDKIILKNQARNATFYQLIH